MEVDAGGVAPTLKSPMSAISDVSLSPIVVPENSGYPEGMSVSSSGWGGLSLIHI